MRQQDREYVAIVASLFSAYPQADRNAGDATMVTWAHQLCDINPDILRRAVAKLSNTEAYMPPISQIREECDRLVRGELEIVCGSCGVLISEYERADENTTFYDGTNWNHCECDRGQPREKREWFAGVPTDTLRATCGVCHARFEYLRPQQCPTAAAALAPNICDPCAKTWRRAS